MNKKRIVNSDLNKIRVLQIGMGNNLGGTEVLIKNLNDNLNDNIVFDFLASNQSKIAYEDEYKKNGSKIYKILQPKLITKKKLPKINRKMKDLKAQINFFKNNNNKIDIVHFNAFDLINIQTIILAKIFNTGKIIVHAHNADFTNYKLINKIRHKINMFITDIIANEFIACSENAAKFMFVKKRLDNKKYKVIYNSIPLQRFKYSITKRKKIREKNNFTNDLVIGNVATLNPVKNQFFLLDIFKEILLKKPEAVLIFIGDGKLKEQLINYSNKLDICNNIKFLGLKDNVDEYMQAFDAFVLPSLHEGFGNVLIESQASGLPTIVSKEGISQEVALTNVISYVSLSESPEFWANHIINKVDEITRKDNTAKLFKKGFDMKSYSSHFKDIYRYL